MQCKYYNDWRQSSNAVPHTHNSPPGRAAWRAKWWANQQPSTAPMYHKVNKPPLMSIVRSAPHSQRTNSGKQAIRSLSRWAVAYGGYPCTRTIHADADWAAPEGRGKPSAADEYPQGQQAVRRSFHGYWWQWKNVLFLRQWQLTDRPDWLDFVACSLGAEYFHKQMAVKDSIREELEMEKVTLIEREKSLLTNLTSLTQAHTELINVQKAKDEEIRAKINALCEKDEELKLSQKVLAESQGTVASQERLLAELQRKLGEW